MLSPIDKHLSIFQDFGLIIGVTHVTVTQINYNCQCLLVDFKANISLKFH